MHQVLLPSKSSSQPLLLVGFDVTVFWKGKGKEKCSLFWACYVQHPVLVPECPWRWASCSGVCSGSSCLLPIGTRRLGSTWGLSAPYCGFGSYLCEPGVQRPSSDSFCCVHVIMGVAVSGSICLSLTERLCLLCSSHQGEKRIKLLKSGPFSLNAIK